MKIPAEKSKREALYLHVKEQCLRTVEERRARYSENRNLYVFGESGARRAVFNKIEAQIDQIVAFMYASESVRFDVEMPDRINGGDPERDDVLRMLMQQLWFDSDGDEAFSHALTYSFVFGATIVKVYWRDGELNVGYLNPGNFGVYDEAAKMTDQEAVVQTYMITKEQLIRQALPGEPLYEILLHAGTRTTDEEEENVGGMPLWLVSTEPNLEGSLNPGRSMPDDTYLPSPMEEVVEMAELWIYDDDLHQYRTVKIVGDIIVSDHPNVVFKQTPTLPFVRVCPSPLPEYFWGKSEVAKLQGLQEWREKRIREIRELVSLQANPPKLFIGMSLPEEKALAMFRPGGIAMNPSPTGKMESNPPTISPNMGQELQQIDEMFAEASAVTPILAGMQGAGKNAGHTQALAELAGARIRKRVLLVEKSLDDLATKMLMVLRENDDTEYTAANGKKFMLIDMPDGMTVHVAAHSSSPLFKGGVMQVADTLLLANALDKKSLIEMLDPPMRDTILERLKIAEADQAKMVAQLSPQQAKQLEKSGG
jgi:hypothetical protein